VIVKRPNRVEHSYTQQLAGTPAEVFPLLCPVREADWIEGWDPLLVVSESGVAEPDCVFVTAAQPADAVWFVVRHEPAAGYVEMLKINPTVTACKLCIQLTATPTGTAARVSYAYTSLGPQGDDFVAAFTPQHYVQFMQDWEARLNRYLRAATAS
jgi:hypothetical protein